MSSTVYRVNSGVVVVGTFSFNENANDIGSGGVDKERKIKKQVMNAI